MTRQQTREILLAVPPEVAFELLVTCSHIQQWWSAAYAIVMPGEGGTWTVAWGDDSDQPDYITSATITKWEPGRLLVFGDYHYHSKEGPLPFKADFVTRFEIEPHKDGSLLRVNQSGFPDDPAADDFYEACGNGWHQTFLQMQHYASTLLSQPD